MAVTRENNLFSLAVGYKKKEMSMIFQGLAVHFFCFTSFNSERVIFVNNYIFFKLWIFMKIIYENCGVKNYIEEGHRMIFFHIISLALPSR